MASLAPANVASDVIRLAHYVYPSAFLVWFAGSQAFAMCSLTGQTAPKREHKKRMFTLLQLVIVTSYVSDVHSSKQLRSKVFVWCSRLTGSGFFCRLVKQC